ncbi:Malonyl-CoA decarboxylase (fragment) [Cupriavidus taiwanensis]|uniref:Malonyl-CoA decarboxylase n=1 Tax=Cupriavidus taiwanensis TaxID=164546 RepID=A0A375I902_9BURK
MNSFDTGDQKISAPLGESEPSSSNILSRLGRWWGRKGEGEAKANGVARAATPADDEAPLPARAVRRQREQLRLCFDARLTDGAANAAAQAWQAEYEAAGEATRRGMLAVLAEVAGSGSEDAAAEGDKGARAGQAQSSARIRFFKRLAALHGQRGNSACGLYRRLLRDQRTDP